MKGPWGKGRSHFATAKEVATLLGVSSSYIYQLLRDGELPGVRIGNCWRVDMRVLPSMSGKLPLLHDLEERLAKGQPKAPKTDLGSEDVNMLLSENARLRAILEKQRAEIEVLEERRRA